MEPNNTERICITWLECSSLIRYWTWSFIILKRLRIWDIEPINSVNISTTTQATNLILIGHRALKNTYVMVQKGQKSPKVDIEPDNSQTTKWAPFIAIKMFAFWAVSQSHSDMILLKCGLYSVFFYFLSFNAISSCFTLLHCSCFLVLCLLLCIKFGSIKNVTGSGKSRLLGKKLVLQIFHQS